MRLPTGNHRSITSRRSAVTQVATSAAGRRPARGTVLPECRLVRTMNDGASTDIHLTDLLSPCFTALRFSPDHASDETWQQLQETLASNSIPFETVSILANDAHRASGPHAIDQTGRLHDMFDAQPGTVYLIRPDGHVLARWRNGSAAATQRAISAALTT